MKKELKIGAFTVCVIVISFFVLNYLRGEDIFDLENEYVAEYSDLEGLVASAPVYIKGYKAGKVSDITFDKETGLFSVTCSVSKDFNVPSDSRMVICSMDIMGSKGVRIDLGQSDSPADDGDSLVPSYEEGLVDGLSAGIAPLMDKVENMIDSLGVTVSGINQILTESNTTSINRILAHVESLTADLESLSSSVDGKSEDIAELIVNLKSFSGQLDGVMSRIDTTITGVGTAVSSINAADLTGTINSLKTLVDNINDPDGSIGKLLNDDSVYNSVDTLLLDLDRFLDKMLENPKKFVKFSLF